MQTTAKELTFGPSFFILLKWVSDSRNAIKIFFFFNENKVLDSMACGITRILSWICHCDPRSLLLATLNTALATSSWVWTVFDSRLARCATFPSCMNHSPHLYDLCTLVLQISQEDGEDFMMIFWYGCYLLQVQKGYKSGVKNDKGDRENKDTQFSYTKLYLRSHSLSISSIAIGYYFLTY